MSTTYTDLTETNFPDGLDTMSRMSDLNASELSLVNSYYTYKNAGNDTAAQALLTANPTLETMIINAAKINKYQDIALALERYFLNELQNYLAEQFTYIESYNSSTTYYKNNIISLNGEGFICRVSSSVGVSPTAHTTTTNWACIAQQGIQGVSGTGLSPRGLWDSATTFYVDDCVANDNALWQCIVQNSNSEPTSINTNWVCLLDLNNSSNSVIDFTEAANRSNIVTGESISIICGKIKKWFTDLGAAAFCGIGTSTESIADSSSAGSASTLSRSDHVHADKAVSTSATTSTATPSDGQGFTCLDGITTDGYGRVSAKNLKTVTLPTILTKVLTGLSTATAAAITATDTILSALGKLQAQINARVVNTTTVNGHALSSNVTVTASDVSLGNVTNESKSTMFTSPTFTGATYVSGTFKLSSSSYGTSLPSAGTAGRVFFKKVT